MKVYHNVLRKIPHWIDVPDQTLPGIPIIEIYGDCRVLVEGRCAVIQYGLTNIQLRNKCGIVSIAGSNLSMAELSPERMVVTGKIEGVAISGG